MTRHDVGTTMAWTREGTDFLLATVERLPDAALAEPSALPGWTRAHVVGHVARNAEALCRLAAWARTGVETPMYSGPEQRTADIEASAGYSPDRLRRELADTAADLDRDLAALDRWAAPVRSAQGREIPAAELPWMRVREVWLHAVDLGTGATAADFPGGMVDTLLDDVVTALSAKDECPAAELRPPDRDRTWRLGGEGDAVVVSGPAAELAAWLTGRGDGAGLTCEGQLPVLPRWI